MTEGSAQSYQRSVFAVLYREGTGPEIHGWTDGSLRDGWETPLFERGKAAEVLKAYWIGLRWDYDEIDDIFVVQAPPRTDEESITVAGRWIDAPEGRLKVYDVGWGWPWVQIDEE